MTFLELFIIAVGLSMDAFAVSVAKGLSVERLRPRNVLSVALWFGGFQGLMPVIGFFLGVSFASFVEHVDHWIAFVLLGLIGINMIRGAFSKKERDISPDFSFKSMLVMAVATSIDALAVGISFSFFNENIWTAALLIAITTAIFSAIGIYVFKKKCCRLFFFDNSGHIKEQCASCVFKASSFPGNRERLTWKTG
jgi:putative Mn2+ efflux pump MntP